VSSSASPYTRADLAAALERIGLGPATRYSYMPVSTRLGRRRIAERAGAVRAGARCVADVIGPAGTIVVPTYTFSFCRQEVFHVQETPTAGGPWSLSAEFLEYVRGRPGAVRSRDPIHSVAALGRTRGPWWPTCATCFGEGSVHDRLHRLGQALHDRRRLGEATFRHFVEERVGVPFRFHKLFTGQIRDNGSLRQQGWLYYVRVLADNCAPDGSCLEELAAGRRLSRRARRLWRSARRRRAAYYALTVEALERNPWYTAHGPAGDPVALDAARVVGQRSERISPRRFDVPDDRNAMASAAGHRVRRVRCALAALAGQVPWRFTATDGPRVLELDRSGEVDLPGSLLGDARRAVAVLYADHPSTSCHTPCRSRRGHAGSPAAAPPRAPDAAGRGPVRLQVLRARLGLCCTRRLRDGLTDERYRVVIRTSFITAPSRWGKSRAGASARASSCAPTCVIPGWSTTT